MRTWRSSPRSSNASRANAAAAAPGRCIRSSAGCRRQRGCDGDTCTLITTCGSSDFELAEGGETEVTEATEKLGRNGATEERRAPRFDSRGQLRWPRNQVRRSPENESHLKCAATQFRRSPHLMPPLRGGLSNRASRFLSF